MTAAQIVQAFVQCGGALALVALLYSLFRRLDYLSAQLAEAKGEDRWSDRCSGCGRRLRDRPWVARDMSDPTGRGTMIVLHAVFHTDRAGCRAAADRWGSS